jgi:hypothetical protein
MSNSITGHEMTEMNTQAISGSLTHRLKIKIIWYFNTSGSTVDC